MTLQAITAHDGPRITVNDFLKDPYRIPSLVLSMMDQGFISDSLLRSAGPVQSGAVAYYESTPLYADEDPDIRAEFSEVPVVPTSAGEPKSAFVDERAAAIMVSDRMRRRYDVDPVNRQLTQVQNSMVRKWDTTTMGLLDSQAAHTVSAEGGWGTSGSNIPNDLASAAEAVETATPDNQDGAFGFQADTLVISHKAKFDLLRDRNYEKLFLGGNIADRNLRYTGVMPNRVWDLDVMVSYQVPEDTVYVIQRGRAGFIADELPLQASPLYRDEPRKVWRSDVQRASAIGLDQPKAVAKITGVSASS